jgi:hypothetical protein
MTINNIKKPNNAVAATDEAAPAAKQKKKYKKPTKLSFLGSLFCLVYIIKVFWSGNHITFPVASIILYSYKLKCYYCFTMNSKP